MLKESNKEGVERKREWRDKGSTQREKKKMERKKHKPREREKEAKEGEMNRQLNLV